MTTTQKFIKEFDYISGAGVGVIMVPTRENSRATSALLDYAIAKNWDYKYWSYTTGWESLPERPEEPPHRDKVAEPYAALCKVNDLGGDGKNKWPKGGAQQGGIYVMAYPHFIMNKTPQFIQLLKDYTIAFSETKQRVVLLVPEETSLPKELENDITVLDFELPGKEEVEGIYDRVVGKVFEARGVKPVFTAHEHDTLINACAGMTSMEAEKAMSRALVESRPDNFAKTPKWVGDIKPTFFITTVSKVKAEIIKRSDCLTLLPEATLADVGGLDHLKTYMGHRAEAFTQAAKDFGADRPRGITAIGPPGTGKTLFSKVTGNLLGQRLIRLDIGAVFGKYVGESEAKIRSAIKLMKKMAPVCILVDEVDKQGMANSGKGGDNGVSSRVVATLLDAMQEAVEPMYWIFTANNHEGLEPALIRKGRMDEVFSVLPPNRIERRAILEIHLRKRKQLYPIDLDKIVGMTKGYVSAELEAVAKESVITAMIRKCKVTPDIMEECIGDIKPLHIAFKEKFEGMEQWAKDNARRSSFTDEELDAMATAKKPRLRQVDI